MAFLGFMTVREHEAVVAALKATHNEQRTHWRKDAHSLRERLAGLVREKSWALQDVTALRAELATLKAERDSLLEDKMAMAHDINDLRKAIAHWKKHGQLRDPATGRLIPKAKPTDVFTASHSPA